MAGFVKSSHLRTVLQLNKRCFCSSNVLRSNSGTRKFNEPLSGAVMPRSGGIASMMRLPVQETSEGLDVCFTGIPMDAGASNRSGARLGPRQIRTESIMIKKFNVATRASPFESLMVADVGDIAINPFDLSQAVQQITERTSELMKNGCKPLIMGGDHTISYPIIKAMKEKYGKVGLVHIDAHTDLYEFGGVKYYHGNGFLRAVEEGLIDCNRTAQIGLRGTGFDDDHDVPRKLGFKVVPATECWHKSLVPLMAEVRQLIGDGPVYISFDIDAIDPAFCPGTGTPEIGGLTTIQALEIIRGLRGLNIIGGDLVEVSPPYDKNGTTALTAANLLFEMLCVMPGAKYYE